MMMMRCLSWLRFRAKPRHLPYIYIIYIYVVYTCIDHGESSHVHHFYGGRGILSITFKDVPKKYVRKLARVRVLIVCTCLYLHGGGLWHFKKTKHVKQKSKAWTFQTCASWILEASRFVFYVYHPGAAFSLQKCRGVGPKGGRRAKWIARDFNLELIWSYILKWITRLISLILQSLKKVGEIAVVREGLCWPVYPAARWRKGWADSHVSWF